MLINNPPWLYSVVDKVFFGRVPRIELSPTISIRASPARNPKHPVAIELKPCAGMPDLQEMGISDGNDSQNSKKVSGSKTPLEVE
jgi:hypothetical protein